MREAAAAKTARQARKAAGTQLPSDEQEGKYDEWVDDEEEIEEVRLEKWQRCWVYDIVNVYAALMDWGGTWTRTFSTDEFGAIESNYSTCWIVRGERKRRTKHLMWMSIGRIIRWDEDVLDSFSLGHSLKSETTCF